MLLFELEKESVWTALEKTEEPIIMYGTGNGADKVFEVLDSRAIPISGVAASDGFVRKRQFHGFEVKPVSAFEEALGDFTVIVTFGTQIPEVIENIKNIAKRHRVLVPCVPVIGNEIYCEEFIEKYEEKINLAYSLLADEKSREVYKNYINFEFSGKPEYLFASESPGDEAFPECIPLSDEEVYVDIGAYRGDTVAEFLKITCGKYKKIIAAEPDVKSFKKLCESCAELENFEAVNKAVTGFDGFVGFSSLAGRQSAVGGEKKTECVSLGTLCGESAPTYIKIDSEGCEYEILDGARDILKAHRPKLNVAAYHKSADIFELVILIKSINPDYTVHLRHHPYIPAWDTNLYCR